MSSRPVSLIGAIAIVAFIVSCSSSGSSTIADPTGSVTPSLTDSQTQTDAAENAAAGNPTPTATSDDAVTFDTLTEDQIRELRSLSLEVYAALPADADRTLWTATQSLLDECMGTAGFDYPVESYPDGSGNLAQVAELYPDDALVAVYGYAWRDHAAVPEPPVAPASESTDPAFQAALTDCSNTASDQLGREGLDTALAVFYNAAADMSVAVNLEPDVEAASQAWTSCMHDQGYDVADQRAAEDLAFNDGATAPDDPAAVAVAVADFGCQRQVGLREAQLSARKRLVQEWLDDNPSAITAREAAIDAVVTRSLQLVPDAAG